MSIEIHGTLKPRNNGTFPVAEAGDILMPDGSRLDSFQGTGGVSSWNDLTDKPFYDNTVSETFDLSVAPEVIFEAPALEVSFGKATDTVLTREQLLKTSLYADDGSGEFELPITEDSILMSDDVGTLVGTEFGGFYLAYQTGTTSFDFDGEEVTMDVPETGTYVAGYTDSDVFGGIALRMVCADIQTLEEKFLPMDAIEAKIEEVISSALEGDY